MHSKAYSNLDYLSNKIGARLSGSPQAAEAVKWAFDAMKAAGADTVYLQECMVPHWVRGEKEQAKFISKSTTSTINITALGGTVGTGKNGITAPVVEIKDTSELRKLGEAALKGKIVFYNKPMDPTKTNTFSAYGGAVHQRWGGASWAAKYGAVAVVVRSMGLANNDDPHTGSMSYLDSAAKKIPACAVSVKGAEALSNALKSDPTTSVYIRFTSETLPDEKSYNVIGEIRGSTNTDEIITVGGHLDSWDNGNGAHDDGAGIVHSIEVLRTFKALGIKPKRTIRAVAFMNEENGLRGGKKYAEQALLKKEKHILAMESDRGGFSPRGFTFSGDADKRKKFTSYKSIFEVYGVYDFNGKGGGSDIGPLEKMGVPVCELLVDSQRYFDVHHTPSDTFDKVSKRELEMGAAAMAAMIWLVSENGM